MAQNADSTLPPTRRIRRSLGPGHAPPKPIDKENATASMESLAASRKKSRSKSMGPGGLATLKSGSGNRRASLAVPTVVPRSILKPTISPLPEIPPAKTKGARSSGSRSSGTDSAAAASKPDNGGSKVAVRTEEEQQEAARQREERERRDARRKSLANRRVSFAAEATLHTFHEIDFNHESTSSTDSTRRQSSVAKQQSAPKPEPTPFTAPPSKSSSSHNDDAQSMLDSSDDDAQEEEVEENIVEDDDDSNSSDSDDGTMMSMDDATGTSIGSERTRMDDGDGSTLDEALRLAAQRAGSNADDDFYDDDGDETDGGEEIIPSFGWIKKPQPAALPTAAVRPEEESPSKPTDETTEMEISMDMTHGMGKILGGANNKSANDEDEDDNDDEDMSMEVTQAVGAILSKHMSQPAASQQQVSDDEEDGDEMTMDFTSAIGGIRKQAPEEDSEHDEDEDMSMEMTKAMGGLINQAQSRAAAADPVDVAEDTGHMDMTVGLGGIISASAPEAEEDDNEADMSMGMEETMAVGGILGEEAPPAPTAATSTRLEQPAQPTASPSRTSPAKLNGAAASGSAFSKTNRPALASRFSSGTKRKSPSPGSPSTPQPATPVQKSPSPAKSTPRSARRTPQTVSPQRQRKPASPVKSSTNPLHKPLVFRNDSQSGSRTPTVVLTPRKLSGVGIDRDGLGSPRVAQLMDRRGSIGDSSAQFVPGKRAVAFESPKVLAAEFERERQEDEEREKARTSNETSEGSTNLREMIDSLSPKRNLLRGRKSLAVGSAMGLLGKRPAELDSDEEEEENDGIKRLKNHQGSPVKNIRLQQPPSKADYETSGFNLKLSQRSPEKAHSASPLPPSPTKKTAPPPRPQLRFQINDEETTTHFDDDTQQPLLEQTEGADGQIHLQDFLNMTSIRFMELNTTKRRHTIAPGNLQDGSLDDGQDDMSLEKCVVAGACTVPNLELYQHSCRELKKYISEGRRIVREIETDTFEENPPLFREYISATPDVKALMDNQFKNVKTHARLLSKAMWYEWRAQLQNGLKDGLDRIAEDMKSDEELLSQQEELLSSTLPDLHTRYEAMQEESSNLEAVARELDSCDPAELQAARDELVSVDDDIERKKRMIAELKAEFETAESTVQELSTQKTECQESIKDTEKIREDCRGWTSTEVNALKAQVDKLEQEHGWAVISISGSWLSLTYRREIELSFDIASVQSSESHIEIRYVADGRQNHPLPMTAQKEYFVRAIQDHAQALPRDHKNIHEMLQAISQAWDIAKAVSSDIERVNITFPTIVSKLPEEGVAIKTSLLVAELQSRVEVTLNLHSQGDAKGFRVTISPEAKIVYGERFNMKKIVEFLTERLGEQVGEKEESWSDVMVELHQKLVARGRR